MITTNTGASQTITLNCPLSFSLSRVARFQGISGFSNCFDFLLVLRPFLSSSPLPRGDKRYIIFLCFVLLLFFVPLSRGKVHFLFRNINNTILYIYNKMDSFYPNITIFEMIIPTNIIYSEYFWGEKRDSNDCLEFVINNN